MVRENAARIPARHHRPLGMPHPVERGRQHRGIPAPQRLRGRGFLPKEHAVAFEDAVLPSAGVDLRLHLGQRHQLARKLAQPRNGRGAGLAQPGQFRTQHRGLPADDGVHYPARLRFAQVRADRVERRIVQVVRAVRRRVEE
ncbi:hypothetical protein WR25_15044 [Diploscapter pachys]|uniref:Uncharacterized protein n=1 Tax=Diploscapter pachys TaxID=2018661 RepID=A0A2A2KJR8_9BILA|nr:hypothetical protein WR25_15044 [Diploscapter pachys]